jgi:hypothetical protein
MIQRHRIGLACGLAALLSTASCWADTWTDVTGNFSVEAEFVGVEGRSVVLRKSDGSVINVPIDKLNDASREKARQLYQASRTGAAPAGGAPASSVAGSAAMPAATAGATKPMEPFPADVTLQQTIDHIRDQMTAGHPEVLWHALPTSMRTKLDSDEVRAALQPMIQQQAQMTKPIEDLLKKVLQVLTKQKEYVLNSSIVTSQVPPPIMPMVRQAYDPAVGILSELVSMQFAIQKSGDKTFTEVLNYHGPRLGGHMTALMPMLPPGAVDQAFGQIKVAQTGSSSGTVTIPGNEGEQVIQMVRYEDRWIPQDLATNWDQTKDTLAQNLAGAWTQANAQNPQAMQQANAMIGMVTMTANGMIDPLLNAKNQQEFDQAIMQLMGLASMFGGGGGPGGLPGGPGGF